MNNIQKLCTAIAIIVLPARLAAQNVTDASNVSSYLLQTESITCAGATAINSLNVDMTQIASFSTCFGCAILADASKWGGNGLDYHIWAAGFSGVDNGCTTGYSGVTIGLSLNTAISGQASQKLPWDDLSNTIYGNPVDYVDVAVGMHYDYDQVNQQSYPQYFLLAVFESGGEIYLDYYDVSIDWWTGSVSLTAPALNANSRPISNSSGTAKRPHIDLLYGEGVTPTYGADQHATSYVITWQQGGTGSEEVWVADGPIGALGSLNPAAPNQVFQIDDGIVPDVVGITSTIGGGMSSQNRGYVTYLNRAGDKVMLSSWHYNGSGLKLNLGSLGTTSNSFHYPRISGPQYFNFSGSPANDPVAVVALTEFTGSRYRVNTYAYHDPTGSPFTNTMNNASDYMSNGFSSNDAMMPVITGVGALSSAAYAPGGGGQPYTDYPVVFYADYTHDNNIPAYLASGDLYVCGTDVASTSPIVNLDGGTNYWEANDNSVDLNFTSARSMTPGNEPILAAATTDNAGYDLMVAWWDGNEIRRKYTGGTPPYVFKPGRPSGVTDATGTGLTAYPNPVADVLYITKADGANYNVTDALGRTLSNGKLEGNKAQVATTALTPGIYILTISKDGRTEKVKFVKQ